MTGLWFEVKITVCGKVLSYGIYPSYAEARRVVRDLKRRNQIISDTEIAVYEWWKR